MMYCTVYDSPVGMLLLKCTDRGLTGIYMDREQPRQCSAHPVLCRTKIWLDAYFRGGNPPVEIPLSLEGTAFQQTVWKLLLTIPYGQLRTYADIAREAAAVMGKDKMSAQAVGQAVGRNPVSILIPCHRVVGSKGSLTGYAGGVNRKAWLLRHEGHRIENDRIL